MMNQKGSENVIKRVNNESSSFEYATTLPPLFQTLSKEQQNEAKKIANKIDLNFETILNFGANIQKEVKHFTHNLLVHVQKNQTSSIRETLFQLQRQLEKIDTNQLVQNKSFFSKFFNQNKKSLQEVVSEYHRLSKNIDRMAIQLQHAQKDLMHDNKMLDNIYEQNKNYFETLNVYIAAGEMKKQFIVNEIEQLKKTIKEDNPIELQQLHDAENTLEIFERRIYDMQISREIAIQTAPQIRMIQDTNQMLLEKIQSSILTTIPLWQSQISMIVNINKQKRLQETTKRLAEQVEKGIHSSSTDMINSVEELKKNQILLLQSIDEVLTVEEKGNMQQTELENTIQKIQDVKSMREVD